MYEVQLGELSKLKNSPDKKITLETEVGTLEGQISELRR